MGALRGWPVWVVAVVAVVHNQRMTTQPDSASSDMNRQGESNGLSFPPVWSIVLDFAVSLLLVGVGVLALNDPPGLENDLQAVAAFLAAGLALGLAISRLGRRSMITRHMHEVHPGAPLPPAKSTWM
jgi:hypothetical protein